MIKRHILKSITYRLLSSCIGFLIIFFFTVSIKIGATFSIAELIFKPIIYFLHERAWFKYIKYGIKIN
jgi:uncharacterized membrane protein